MQTLGDVITLVLLLFGVPFVAWVFLRAWIVPVLRPVGAMARHIIMSRLTAVQLPQTTIAPPPATTATTSNNVIAIERNDSNEELLRAAVVALAKLVNAGKVGQTEGIYVVFGEKASSTNPRYLHIRDMLREEITHHQPQPAPRYPARTPAQQTARAELGLEQKP